MSNKTYKAITLNQTGGKLSTTSKTLRDLKPNEVLVKMAFSTILPSDCHTVMGGKFKTPFTAGNEGSGVIEAVGSEVDKNLVGKHVSTTANYSPEGIDGCWQEYLISPLQNLIIYESKVPLDHIFAGFVNPLTLLGFYDTIIKKGHKAVAHNGASSALGRIFLRLCIDKGIEVVNVVRKEQSIKELTELGGKHFVNTSDKDWETKLAKKLEELQVLDFFECVGGAETGKVVKALPRGGTCYHFGNLLLQNPCEFDSLDFIYNGKKLEGFILPGWLSTLKPEEALSYKKMISDDFDKNNGKLFSTSYVKEFNIDQAQEAFEYYQKEGKKIVIKF